MQLPREVLVGNGTLSRTAEVARMLGFTKSALIIAGSKTYEVAGKRVKALLEEEGMQIDVFTVETATIGDVEAVEARIKQVKPEVVFGVGGGTKIDVAKLSSANQMIPFISVPTTASHDGFASPLTSVKGFSQPFSVMAQAPLAIIADTGIISQAPWRFSVSGSGDVISKLTAVKDWKLAHEVKNEYFGGYAASLALMSAKLVIQNSDSIRPGDEEGLRILIEALVSCGVSMSIAGSSRPCSGSEHLFCHAMNIIKPNHYLHGELCGVGAIMMAYLHGTKWERVRDTLKKLGAPTTAADLGTDESVIVKALEMAADLRPDRYTILNEARLDCKSCQELARKTGVT
jgi:glycerol-1-phosphate dehydrogenase [NAD(P)+]